VTLQKKAHAKAQRRKVTREKICAICGICGFFSAVKSGPFFNLQYFC
jgi:hypothetical protein